MNLQNPDPQALLYFPPTIPKIIKLFRKSRCPISTEGQKILAIMMVMDSALLKFQLVNKLTGGLWVYNIREPPVPLIGGKKFNRPLRHPFHLAGFVSGAITYNYYKRFSEVV